MSTSIRTALTGASVVGMACGAFAVDPRNLVEYQGAPHNSAIISNGTIRLGVNDEGHLNLDGGVASVQYLTTVVGVRLITTAGEYESTSPGCLCEGWGASAGAASGWASIDNGGISGLSLNGFVGTPSTAVSDVSLIATPLQVVHDYHPSTKTANLYEVTVTLKNTGAAPLSDVRYVRVMDWDVEPTTFSEFVTIKGTATTTLLETSHDNGFSLANPLALSVPLIGSTLDADFTDVGPTDHGAYFRFNFGTLEPGASKSFNIYYGAAGTESLALAAIGSESIELYSLGQQSGDPLGGTPATFIFGFKGVGGKPIEPNPVIPEASTVVGAFGLVGLIGSSLWLRRRRQA